MKEENGNNEEKDKRQKKHRDVKTNGWIITQARREINMSQAKLAELLDVNQRTLARMEAGTRNITIWEYLAIMQLMGQSTENFIELILQTEEFEIYSKYKQLRKDITRMVRARLIPEAKAAINELENLDMPKIVPTIQYIGRTRIFIDEDMDDEEAIERLYKLLRLTIKKYHESRISEYRLTHEEAHILNAIAVRLVNKGEEGKAISLFVGLINGKDKSLITQEDKADLYPALLVNLTNHLGRIKRYKEVIYYSEMAREMCIEHNNLSLLPYIYYNLACAHHSLGEQDIIWDTFLTRAYHGAYMVNNISAAEVIKKDAKEDFGITL